MTRLKKLCDKERDNVERYISLGLAYRFNGRHRESVRHVEERNGAG